MKKTLSLIVRLALCLAWAGTASAAGQDWQLLFTLQADQATGPLRHPLGLFIDPVAERYYVADSGRNRLVSFDKTGKLLHAFTAGGALDKPIALSKGAGGHLLVLEKGKGGLTEIDIKGRTVTPHPLADRGEALIPQRLQANDDGLALIDQASGDLVVLDQAFTVQRRLHCPDCPAGYADLAVKDGQIYALPLLAEAIHHFDQTGNAPQTIPLNPAPAFPIALALSPDGGFLVLERHGEVLHYQADGHLLARHLGPGERPGSLAYPAAIQVDPWGRVCVVEEGNGRVSVFQP